MSRSNPISTEKNPAQMWIEWDGSNGSFRHYDKDAQENVYLDGLTFLYLDKVGAVTGYSDTYGSNIFSNQVRSSKKEKFIVSSFNKKDGPIAEGLWENIKDLVNAKGGKFTANIYAAIKMNDALQIVCIQFKGAALSAWSTFSDSVGEKALSEKAVKLTGKKQGKKGSITFYTPEFALIDVKEETNAAAIELDKALQQYLNAKMSQNDYEAAPAQEHSQAVSIDEKKKLSASSPNFPNILANIQSGESALASVTDKYDVDPIALELLNKAENAALMASVSDDDDFGAGNDDDLPF